jgi:hypothetical protein
METGGVFVVSAALALMTIECGGATAAPHELADEALHVPPPHDSRPPVRAESDLDRTLRMQLAKAFSEDPALKDRHIALVVQDGDVTVTGSVGSNAEREKTNEIAMNVAGIRSVSNALRVSPEQHIFKGGSVDGNTEDRSTDVEPTGAGDQHDDNGRTSRTEDVRKLNDNIRKSQGDDAGQRPVIDRHR